MADCNIREKVVLFSAITLHPALGYLVLGHPVLGYLMPSQLALGHLMLGHL